MTDFGPLFRTADEFISTPPTPSVGLRVVGLFAGVGGIELGLHRTGHRTELLCEYEHGARTVLQHQFPDVEVSPDVRDLSRLPSCDLLTAGFPCQDLSQAGRTAGIKGEQSGLVGHVFRLLDGANEPPKWLLIENVPFMLQLDRGAAMRYLVDMLEARGFRWAYRIVDTRSFGLPQRRRRVILLASQVHDPRTVLYAQDSGCPPSSPTDRAYGFYWTEGKKGLGWAPDAVPTLKGGSGLGIPSPPGIWVVGTQSVVTPDIRDAERLQGFPEDWTRPAVDEGGCRRGHRWKLVGNAVSVPVAEWLGRAFAQPAVYDGRADEAMGPNDRWPSAAWGFNGTAYRSTVSEWPVDVTMTPVLEFLKFPTKPLSFRATRGFLKRAGEGRLRFDARFLSELEAHKSAMAV